MQYFFANLNEDVICWDSEKQTDRGAYICQVSQLNLHMGLGCLGLRPHSHSNNLGVHNCVVPESNREAQKEKIDWLDFQKQLRKTEAPVWDRSCAAIAVMGPLTFPVFSNTLCGIDN